MNHEPLTRLEAALTAALDFFQKDMAALHAGRADPALVAGVEVDAYDSRTPLAHVATVTVPSATELRIEVWDRGLLVSVEKALTDCKSLGTTPANTGDALMLRLPPLTAERRQEMVKIVHEKAEHARIAVRNARHAALAAIKKDEELSEDEQATAEKQAEKQVSAANDKIAQLLKQKEQSLQQI